MCSLAMCVVYVVLAAGDHAAPEARCVSARHSVSDAEVVPETRKTGGGALLVGVLVVSAVLADGGGKKGKGRRPLPRLEIELPAGLIQRFLAHEEEAGLEMGRLFLPVLRRAAEKDGHCFQDAEGIATTVLFELYQRGSGMQVEAFVGNASYRVRNRGNDLIRDRKRAGLVAVTDEALERLHLALEEEGPWPT